LEKQLRVSRGAISSFTKKRFGRNFNQFLDLWRIAELRRLQSLPENRGLRINQLCLKAGFSGTRQYYQAEEDRKTRKRKKREKEKNEPIIKKHDGKNDLDVIKKPEINMRRSIVLQRNITLHCIYD
ncbi:MAG: hypothetical protein LBU62_03150, partial [Bacteroidales bacterium]|nr:hypothetical protein [Bacteroidales bacterium]